MADEPPTVAAGAALLLDARRSGRTTDLLTRRWPDMTMAMAEKIASATVALSGEPVVGIKLGFTSAAMRRQMHVTAPNFGWLTADMDLTANKARPGFIHPRVEPEVAVVLARPIGDTPLAPGEALRAIGSVHAALEIVDTRYHEYRFTLIDNTADNSSAAAFVLGPARLPATLVDRALSVMLRQGDNPAAHGSSSDAMGGPLIAVEWLAAALLERGLVLPAGAIILTGGLTAAPYLHAGEAASASFAELGTVEIRL